MSGSDRSTFFPSNPQKLIPEGSISLPGDPQPAVPKIPIASKSDPRNGKTDPKKVTLKQAEKNARRIQRANRGMQRGEARQFVAQELGCDNWFALQQLCAANAANALLAAAAGVGSPFAHVTQLRDVAALPCNTRFWTDESRLTRSELRYSAQLYDPCEEDPPIIEDGTQFVKVTLAFETTAQRARTDDALMKRKIKSAYICFSPYMWEPRHDEGPEPCGHDYVVSLSPHQACALLVEADPRFSVELLMPASVALFPLMDKKEIAQEKLDRRMRQARSALVDDDLLAFRWETALGSVAPDADTDALRFEIWISGEETPLCAIPASAADHSDNTRRRRFELDVFTRQFDTIKSRTDAARARRITLAAQQRYALRTYEALDALATAVAAVAGETKPDLESRRQLVATRDRLAELREEEQSFAQALAEGVIDLVDANQSSPSAMIAQAFLPQIGAARDQILEVAAKLSPARLSARASDLVARLTPIVAVRQAMSLLVS